MTELVLTEKILPGFSHLIPERLQKEILDYTVVGIAWYDEEYEAAAAVILCREIHDWMELVWLCVSPDYQGIHLGEQLLRKRISDARIFGNIRGVFGDIPEGDIGETVKHMLFCIGFTETVIERPVYEITVGELENTALLRPKSDGSMYVPLGKADNALKGMLLEEIRGDERPVPLELPVDWNRYHPTLSVIYVRDGKPVGVVLAEDGETSVNFSLLWSISYWAVPFLLSYAARKAWEICPRETRILIPTVTELSEKLLLTLLPGLKRQPVVQARYCYLPELEKEV